MVQFLREVVIVQLYICVLMIIAKNTIIILGYGFNP